MKTGSKSAKPPAKGKLKVNRKGFEFADDVVALIPKLKEFLKCKSETYAVETAIREAAEKRAIRG